MDIKKSYLLSLARFAGTAAMFLAVLLFGSCQHTRNVSPLQPADAYRNLLSCVRQMDTLSTSDLVCQLKAWKSLSDSVSSALVADTLLAHSTLDMECRLLHDSLRIEFSRLALSQLRTFADVLVVKEALSPIADDSVLASAVRQIRPFFDSLDVVPAVSGSSCAVLSRYRMVLSSTLADSIHSLSELRDFIRDEDAAYRSFISRLHGLGNTDVSDITRDTERCCLLVAHAVDCGGIPYGEASVYMAMRTGRRLLQNASVCLADIRHGCITRREQAWAYACMLLQPYVSMDGLSLALLSAEDKDELFRIAGETPEALQHLQKVMQASGGRLHELPAMLLDMYIASL